VLPLDAELSSALLADVAPRAWRAGRRVVPVAPVPLPEGVTPVVHAPSVNAERRGVIEAACTTLLGLEAELNALDAKVGDGDTGSTFATAARAILSDLDVLPFDQAAELCAAVGQRLSKVMGGSSGILLSIGVSSMGAAISAAKSTTPDWPAALREGLRRIQEYGGANEGDRTMLDALGPAVTSLEKGEGLAAAAAAAQRGANHTASMTSARAGRSSYVPEASLQGVPDPGAVAFAKVFEALARS
jgi:dihydroxyacetone kinase